MAKLRAIGLAIGSSMGLLYTLKSMATGAINLGNKHREAMVRFAEEPGLFLFGVIFMLILSVGCLAAAWQLWKTDDD